MGTSTQVYAPRYRQEWLQKIEHAGVRRRAELLYQQLDGLQAMRRTLRPELLTPDFGEQTAQACEILLTTVDAEGMSRAVACP